ncbi:MAG: 50S ribosomal protein L10 [Patescibacteria group bacterium]
MILTRPQKEKLVKEMSVNLSQSKAVILVNYQGLKVKEIQELKKRLHKQGIGFRIVKNSLFKIALKNASLNINENLLDQPVAIIWGAEDEVTPAKLIVTYQKEVDKFQIIGGLINRNFAEKNIILTLASIPSREELYAKLVGTLNTPIYRLVSVLKGNLKSLVYLLDQYRQQKA